MDRALRRLGFAPTRQRGSHVFYAHADGRRVSVPRHHGSAIGPGLIAAIARQINVPGDDLRRLL